MREPDKTIRDGTVPPRRAVIPGVAMIELLPPEPYETAYTPAQSVIGFAFDAQAGSHAFGSDRRTPFRASPNHLSFIPSGCDVYSQSVRGGEYLRIFLGPGDGGEPHRQQRFSDVIDTRAIALAARARSLLMRGEDDCLVMEQLVDQLSQRVTAILAGPAERAGASAWMTPRRLRLSLELIEAELATRLTVARLAASLDLSAGLFSRAFKGAVGKPPHDYIIDRRIARARALLRSPRLDLAAIAQEVGFNSHAHMTSAFRNRLGVTPTDIRRGIE
jgi:AraC family transcriptional regulator